MFGVECCGLRSVLGDTEQLSVLFATCKFSLSVCCGYKTQIEAVTNVCGSGSGTAELSALLLLIRLLLKCPVTVGRASLGLECG